MQDSKNEKFSDLFPNIEPIKKNNLFDLDLQKQKPKPIPHQTILGKKKVLEESISNEDYINANNNSENLWKSSESYHLKNGVAKKTLNILKAPFFNSEQILDLHGFNIEDAYFEFRNFIDHSYKKSKELLRSFMENIVPSQVKILFKIKFLHG